MCFVIIALAVYDLVFEVSFVLDVPVDTHTHTAPFCQHPLSDSGDLK